MFQMTLKVRYAETDQMGIVYYANYFVWMECIRTQWFETICGLSYAELEKQGLFLPVLEANCQYKKAIRYPEEVDIFLIPRLVKSLYIEFDYEISVKKELRAIGYTKHVFMDKAFKIKRIPDFVMSALK